MPTHKLIIIRPIIYLFIYTTAEVCIHCLLNLLINFFLISASMLFIIYYAFRLFDFFNHQSCT